MALYTIPTYYDNRPVSKTPVGGHPLHFRTETGRLLCHQCVADNMCLCRDKNSEDWLVVADQINWADTTLSCAHCGCPIKPAYDGPEL